MNKDLNLIELTLRQLRRLASEFGVSRYSRMRKEQLVSALEQAKDVQLTPVYPTRSEASVAVEPPQEMVEASKFIVGQEDLVGGELASVDEALPDLPGVMGRVVLCCFQGIPNGHIPTGIFPMNRKKNYVAMVDNNWLCASTT